MNSLYDALAHLKKKNTADAAKFMPPVALRGVSLLSTSVMIDLYFGLETEANLNP